MKNLIFYVIKVLFHINCVTKTAISEYGVTVVLCGKLVYWLVRFNTYDQCYDYQLNKIKTENLFAKSDLKYQSIFTTDSTYLRMFPSTKHILKLISNCLLVSYGL